MLAGCESGTTPRPTTPASSPSRNTSADPTPARTGGAAQANVIRGTVTSGQGAPISGARLRVVGYTGGASLGREIETVVSGADGTYSYKVPAGLYEVLGQATIAFDGQSYVFDLVPADGACGQEMSTDGIVKDFVLKLTGLRPCRNDTLPDNYTSYQGAAIQLFNRLAGSPAGDAIVEYTLQPTGSLADGSPGKTLTMKRTITALRTSAGPIDSTWILYDIPLATYRVSAALLGSGGGRTALLVSSATTSTPAASVVVSFDARKTLGGYMVPQVYIHDAK